MSKWEKFVGLKNLLKLIRKREDLQKKKTTCDSVNNLDDEAVNIDVNMVNNTPTTSDKKTTTPVKQQTVSQSKVVKIVSATPKSSDAITGYRLVGMIVLNSVIEEMRCPDCSNQTLKLKEKIQGKRPRLRRC